MPPPPMMPTFVIVLPAQVGSTARLIVFRYRDFARSGEKSLLPESRRAACAPTLLCVVAGPRMCDQVWPVEYLNLYFAPLPVALFVERLVAQAVNLTKIIDHLLVDSVKIGELLGF